MALGSQLRKALAFVDVGGNAIMNFGLVSKAWSKVLHAFVFLGLCVTSHAQADIEYRLDKFTPAGWFGYHNLAWDWFGYQWHGEYGGNVYDEDGVCRGRIYWLDYNDIVTISQAALPAYNWHYKRLKGFGLGINWIGKLYQDDKLDNPIPMSWIFIPQGEIAWIEFRYTLQAEDGSPIPIHIGGYLRYRGGG